VVNHVSRYLSYEGAALVEAFREALAASGAPMAEESDDERGVGSDDDDDEDLAPLKLSPKKKAKAGGGGGARVSSPPDGDGDGLDRLRGLASEAAAVCMLLAVKHYLKAVYRLTDAKCTDYAPSESTKATEKAVYRPDEMPPLALPAAASFGQHIGGWGNPWAEADGSTAAAAAARAPSPATKEALVEQFKAFQLLMRQDPTDFRLVAAKAKGRGGKRAVAGGGGGEGGDDDDAEPTAADVVSPGDSGYKCKKCGLPKKGHVCAFNPKAVAAAGKKAKAKAAKKQRRKKSSDGSEDEEEEEEKEDDDDEDYH